MLIILKKPMCSKMLQKVDESQTKNFLTICKKSVIDTVKRDSRKNDCFEIKK